MTRPRKKPRGWKDSEKALVLRGRGEEGWGGAGKEGDVGFQQAAHDSDLQELNEASSPAKGTTKELERFANMSGSTPDAGEAVHPRDNDFSPKQQSHLKSRAPAVTSVTPVLRFHQ